MVHFRNILKKESVDPIQDAIITENVLAVMGVAMPVITSFLCYSTGLGWIDSVGEISNGFIQIYLGYLICKENSQILIGKSVGQKDHEKILDILKNRKEINSVSDLKTRWSNEILEISASVSYNQKALTRNIIRILDDDINKITSDKGDKDKLQQLLAKSTSTFIVEASEIVKNIEDDIRKAYPKVIFIDIEKGQTNINKDLQGIISSTINKSTASYRKISN